MDEKPKDPNPVLVEDWKDVLLKSWVVRIAGIAIVIPELAELLLGNLDTLGLSPEWKNYVRLAALALVIIARPIHQKSLHKEHP